MLFGTPVSNDRNFVEGSVLAVDATRFVCKVKTVFGQHMDGVTWLTGMYETPEFGDRVLITTATGYPIILGILPRVGAPSEFATDVDTGQLSADTGNYSTLSSGTVNDPLKPGDLVSGDKIFSNESGTLFGMLRGGSFVARASKLAQIFVTRFDDLVRIVARNFEIFTDLFVDVSANVRGRVYRFIGYGDTAANARADIYKYKEFYGDTVLGQELEGSNYGYTPGTFSALPAADNVIRKYTLLDGSGSVLSYQTLNLVGSHHLRVQNAATTSYTYVDHILGQHQVKSTDGSVYCQVTTTPSSIVLTYNGGSTVTISSNNVNVTVGSTTATFTGSTAAIVTSTATITSGSNVFTVDGSKIEMDIGGNKSTLSPTQFKVAFGTNTVEANSSSVSLTANSGGHYFRVTQTGLEWSSPAVVA